ncbi:aldehyde dehydrogenase (NAD+) [Pseudoduganella namucuonensis]|uniref:Aldehyde dehydrogenase (NAD+) n=2 Tax=Pseudoduganella namucuonensis TaxID=1035707 RepID=A0A1I7LPQ8_9BURK|nr:aldehyde dehydrogenase (NAD+) [Pseudoduganella namucuonensis]
MDMKPNYIDGAWREAASARPNINPSDTDDVIAHYAQGDAAQAEQAVAAARAAFPAWSRGGIQQRADALDRIGAELLARQRELGELLAREEGKTLPEAVAEVARAGMIFRFFAGEALRPRGECLPSVRPGIDVEIRREPVGVVAIITPWNFPIAIPAWKIAPALAYGNCVVFKPADLVPGSAWALSEIISRSGLPPGVFNLVMGPGSMVGQTFINARAVNAISFTGSVGTGRRIIAAGCERGAKVQVEMGGKNPLVVLADADLAQAVEVAVQGSYFSTGQRCTASSRLIVEKAVLPRFVEAVVARLGELRVGDARAPGTHIGPVVDEGQLRHDLDYIALGREEGATLAFGGRRLERERPGFYLEPALFVDADPGMRVAREEIFGPVACVIAADDYEHALALANDSEFGLSAGICTTSLKHAVHFKREAQAGMVMVNAATAGVDYHVPFGGSKGSSYGAREQGSYAAEFYTTVKTAYTAC